MAVTIARSGLERLESQYLLLRANTGPVGPARSCPTADANQVVTFRVQEEKQGQHMVLGVGIAVLGVAVAGSLQGWWW